MTTAPPIAPRLLKGAIIGTDPANPLASVVVFQYNPDTLTRRIEARSSGGQEGGDRSEAFRLMGPARETISLSVEVDATDQLERADPLAMLAGVYPPLAALEMLLYPKASSIVANDILAQIGNIEIIPPEAPLTLFVWGPARVLPVRITSESRIKIDISDIMDEIDENGVALQVEYYPARTTTCILYSRESADPGRMIVETLGDPILFLPWVWK